MFAAMRWLRDGEHDIDPYALLVALVIASYTDQHGTAFVGTRQIANASRLNRETVIGRIRQLESAGVLSVDRACNGARSTYRFPVENLVKVIPNRSAQDRPVSGYQSGRKSTQKRSEIAANRSAQDQPRWVKKDIEEGAGAREPAAPYDPREVLARVGVRIEHGRIIHYDAANC